MTVLVPRLGRAAAIELVRRHRHDDVADITVAMPDLTPVVTYSPVGGPRMETQQLRELRADVVGLAREHGMPESREQIQRFEGRAARLVHERLRMSPHEASHEEVWSYITCCWLLDVAVWRFGSTTTDDRFIGHLNRNTFRRMWWRAEILGPDIDLTRLGEDELVNIMERPTLFSDRRLARAITLEFLSRVESDGAQERMRLMREATKRLLRLTPFVAFSALGDPEVRLVVSDAFDVAVAGLAGRTASMAPRPSPAPLPASPGVTGIAAMSITPPEPSHRAEEADGSRPGSFEEVAQAALDIARRTGRVTNMTLREVAPITSDEARDVFAALMRRGELVRRGVKRGTHYVLPEAPRQDDSTEAPTRAPEAPASPRESRPPPGGDALQPPPSGQRRPPQRPSETALRRLLRRGRR